MRKFVDLHLRAPIKDLDQVERMVRRSSELGYALVGILLPPNIMRGQIDQLRHICNDASIEFVARVNFSPKTPRERTSSRSPTFQAKVRGYIRNVHLEGRR